MKTTNRKTHLPITKQAGGMLTRSLSMLDLTHAQTLTGWQPPFRRRRIRWIASTGKIKANVRGHAFAGCKSACGGHKHGVTKSLALLTILLASLCLTIGCQPHPTDRLTTDRTEQLTHLKKLYSHVPPRKLDNSLTDQQLKKMFTPLPKIPFPALAKILDTTLFPDDPNLNISPDTTGQTDITNDKQVDPRKIYLQSRMLLKKASNSRSPILFYNQAVTQLTIALPHDPNNPQLHELLGRTYYALGQLSLAAASCRRTLQLDNNSLYANQILATICITQSRHRQAAALLKQALATSHATPDNPQTAVLHMQLAAVLSEMKYYTAAAEQYRYTWKLLLRQQNYSQSNTDIFPLIAQTHIPMLMYAQLHLQMGNIANAVEALRQTGDYLQSKESIVQAFILALPTQNIPLPVRYNHIKALCRYLLTCEPSSDETIKIFYFTSAQLALEKLYLQDLTLWHTPTDNTPALITPRQFAQGLFFADKDDQALAILQNIIATPNAPPLAHLDLAHLFAKNQQWENMIIAYSNFLLKSPQSPPQPILTEIKTALKTVHDLPDQLTQWQNNPQINSSYIASFLLADLASSHDQNDLAQKLYRQTLQIDPNFMPARKALIELLFKAEKHNEVIKWAQLNNHKPSDPEMLYLAGRACLALEKLDQAANYFRQLIDLQKEDYRPYIALAEILYRQNNFNNAQDILLQVLANWPDHHQAYQHLFSLYAHWSQLPDISDHLRQTTQDRTKLMLQRWFKSLREEKTALSPDTPAGQIIIDTLNQLAQQYPTAKNIGIMLHNVYFSGKLYDKAIDQIERLRKLYPHDIQILTLAALLNENFGDINLAADLKLQLFQQNPQDPQLLLYALQTMQQAHQAQRASDLLLQALQQPSWKDNLTVVQTLQDEALNLFITTRQYLQAVDLFEKWFWLVSSAPPQTITDKNLAPAAAENLIWALTEAGYYDRAVLHTVAMFSRYPASSTQMPLWLSRTFNVNLLFDKSIDLLKKILAIKPNDLSLNLQLYMTLADQGQPDLAIEKAQAFLAAQPDNSKRREVLSIILRRTGDVDTAAQLLQADIDKNPDNTDIQLRLAELLIDSGPDTNYTRAQKILARLEDSQKATPLWLDLRVTLDINQGNWQSAFDRVDIFTDDKFSYQLQVLKVKILELSGQLEQAIELQKQIVDHYPDELAPRLRYSLLLDKMGLADQSISQLELLLNAFPDDPSIKNNLSYSLIQQHHHTERAYQLLRSALQNDPQSAPTLDSLGWFYYKEGKFKQAWRYISQAAALMTVPDMEIMDHLGDIAYQLGRPKKAAIYWKRALEDLTRRVKTEKHYQKDKDRIQNKLQQLDLGDNVTVAPLFENEN